MLFRSVEVPHEATDEEVAFGRQVITASGRDLAYARVDVVPSPAGPLLMELEAIEPSLQFVFAPGSEDRMARGLLKRAAQRGA